MIKVCVLLECKNVHWEIKLIDEPPWSNEKFRKTLSYDLDELDYNS